MKKLIAFALVLTMMLSMLVVTTSAAAWDGTTASASLKGEGTEASPYLIESAEDLKYIQVQVDAETGAFYVDLNGARVATGTLGATFAGKTGSEIKFFAGVSQFEANMDNIAIGMIAEAK
jgi:hypothetical protein